MTGGLRAPYTLCSGQIPSLIASISVSARAIPAVLVAGPARARRRPTTAYPFPTFSKIFEEICQP
eukprot:3915571-Prymnesium_polylepis.1